MKLHYHCRYCLEYIWGDCEGWPVETEEMPCKERVSAFPEDYKKTENEIEKQKNW